MIKSTINHRPLLVAAIAFAGVLATCNAHAVEGMFSGSISEKLKVSGCGKDTDFTSASTNIKSNKKWSTATSAGTFSGAYKKKGSRTYLLKLSSKSEKLLMKNMKNWASDLCGTAVKSLSKFKASIKLKLNKKATKLNGKVKANATGKTKFGSGKGKYTGKVRMDAI